MNVSNKYLDMSEGDIDKLLLGIDFNNIKKEKKNKKSCINCKSTNLFHDKSQGVVICEDCDVVNHEILNDSPEFTSFNNEGSRYGCPTNYYFPKSALGTKIKSRGWSKIGNLQMQGQMPYKEKSLMEVLKKIQEKCKKYNITSPIIDNAKNLYKKINDSKHSKGKRKGKNRIMRCINRRSMIAACVFYACKIQKEPRSPKEIADIYDLEIKHVNRGCRKFLDYIDIDTLMCKFKSSQSSDFIHRFADKLDIEDTYIKKARDISENIHKLDLASTHEPPSVAAGCLLLVANMYHLELTKKQISSVFGISDVTISKTYRRIQPYHKIITNNKITNMVLQKRNSIPKKKSDINNSNLVMNKESDYLSESDDSMSDSNESEVTEEENQKSNYLEI